MEIENSVNVVRNDGSGSILGDVEGNSSTPNTSSTPKFNNKRKRDDENSVPRLVVNKNRHLEKRLSQSQRSKNGRPISNGTLSGNKKLK